MRLKEKYLLLLILILFLFVYSIVSLFNHLVFRTYALDLGLYTNALYQYSHFNLANCNVFKNDYALLLSDHFDLYLVLFSPLVYLFGSFTLLIIQILFIVFGAYGVFLYFKDAELNHSKVALLSMLYFLTFFGVFSALSFDYHSNVIAASVVPWFLYFLKQGKRSKAFYLFIFILIAKENMAIWLVFVCLGLLLQERRNKLNSTFLIYLILIALIYFVTVVGYVMPHFSVSGKYDGFKYSSIGTNPLQALQTILTRPFYSLKLLFINPTENQSLDWIKCEFHFFVLLSGLYLLLFRPSYLIMLIPIYMQKMYHNDSSMWGIAKQYSIEFVPILTIGIFSVITEFKSTGFSKFMKYFVLISSVVVTIRSMDHTMTYTKKSTVRFYQEVHYKNTFNVSNAQMALKLLPENAKISALSFFVPHLALRKNIYQFPIVKDAEYIVFNYSDDFYPLNSPKFISEIADYLSSGNWTYLLNSPDIAILKRNQAGRH